MKTTAELTQESVVERLWEEKERQEVMKILARRSILRIIEGVKRSKPSYDIKILIEGIQELATLNAILAEIWNVKDMHKIGATLNKYNWLLEMKRLDEK